jgi:spermidine dehydrogenase
MSRFDTITLYDLFHNDSIRRTLPSALLPPRFPRMVHEVIETALRAECLAENDVSAYSGLHFLVGYLLGELIGFPGGNGGLSRHMTELLWKEPTGALRAASPVKSITSSGNGNGYDVTFAGANGTETVHTRSVVYAAPKRTAVPVIKDMDSEQKAAIGKLRYRNYYQATIFLNRKAWPNINGAYLIRNPTPAHGELCSHCRTGALMASTWSGQKSRKEAITLLKSVARDEDKQAFHETPFDQLQAASYLEAKQLLETAGISSSAIEDVRVWRWENAIITPDLGHFRDGVFDTAGKPIGGIFFAGQDTTGIGNVESAINTGLIAAGQARDHLKKPT